MENTTLTNSDIDTIIHHANKWYTDTFGCDLEEKVKDMIGTTINTSQDAYDLNDFEDQNLQEISLGERDAVDWGFSKLRRGY